MDKPIWKRPVIRPFSTDPAYSESLNGTWKFRPGELASPGADYSVWDERSVPSHTVIDGQTKFAFARDVEIPRSAAGRRIYLRFDGANCLARVYVNSSFAGEHYGGFTAWDCDITDLVIPGGTARLIVTTEDRKKETNSFHYGGIIRDVTLFTLPEVHLSRLQVETRSAEDSWILKIIGAFEGGGGSLRFTLSGADGSTDFGEFTADEGDFETEYTVPNPLLWDSEHPNLYTLTAEYAGEAAAVRFGFKEIERRGSKVYVNGQEIKLHGVNHHDTHPVLGRAVTRELTETDVRLFKEANVNFIRTSHYPPRTDFLELCDEYGIYVECECAAFVGQNQFFTENDPDYLERYLGPWADMIEQGRSHACVLLWSAANESFWGTNFEAMIRYARAEDTSHLLIFSYPITMREDDIMSDIWSVHYCPCEGDVTALTDSFGRSLAEPFEIPVFHDESIHVPRCGWPDIRRDPGVRDFWGESPKRFYDSIWNTPGALGCAIWAGVDEPAWPWGIIDAWRRLKPEYFLTKKAFSPIHMEGEPVKGADGNIEVTITNRFNHTDFSEVKARYSAGDEAGVIALPAAAPRETVTLTLPAPYISGETVSLRFIDSYGMEVDAYSYELDRVIPEVTAPGAGCPEIREDEGEVELRGNGISVVYSKATGLIKAGFAGEKLVLCGGPHLHLTGLQLAPWECDGFGVAKGESAAIVTTRGHYGAVRVTFTTAIDAEGAMKTECHIDDMPYSTPRLQQMRVGDDTDAGGYEEVGISFDVPHELDTLGWDKHSLWNAYPASHIGRERGEAAMIAGYRKYAVAEEPECSWEQDEYDISSYGVYDPGHRGTVDFRSIKSHIYRASLENAGYGFAAVSDGSASVRAELTYADSAIVEDTSPEVVYTGSWREMRNPYRSFGGTEHWSNRAGDTATLRFTGTGVVWIGAFDIIYGLAQVYIDGKLVDPAVNEGIERLDQLVGKPRGYEKDFSLPVYSVDGLPYGEHTITIEVTGEHIYGAHGSHVVIDRFVVLSDKCYGATKFIVDNDYNYPELSWGDYMKPPVKLSTGDVLTADTRLVRP